MTPERILAIAADFAQYKDATQTTLRGDAIVEFARVLLKEHGDADFVRGWNSVLTLGVPATLDYERLTRFVAGLEEPT